MQRHWCSGTGSKPGNIGYLERRAVLLSTLGFSVSPVIAYPAIAVPSSELRTSSNPFTVNLSSPQPVLIPRKSLEAEFAVSLLRSGYETADYMNFVAMDQFQREFWLRRRAEWESYKFLYDPVVVEQGKISDPQYFDFISAMQFTTLSNEMKDGKQVFKEFCGDTCEEPYKLVTRPPELQNNATLPLAFNSRIGALIYEKLGENDEFREQVIPSVDALQKSATQETVRGVIRAVLQYFCSKGYSVRFDIDTFEEEMIVKSYGVATLFALDYCRGKQSTILPLYDALLLKHIFNTVGGEATAMNQVDVSWTTQFTTQRWTNI